jgi:beta-phosphoglucomutase-like phosphatase (HAD superfamily)
MERLAEYLDRDGAAEQLKQLATGLGTTEFARVRNLDYVYSPGELYPLAPRVHPPLARIAAFVVDMDGTSTTTEPLALHALEYMVRRFTGRLTKAEWAGLDPKRDYPHVIGNSNFRHTEFLVERYRAHLDRAALCQAFFEAVCWTLAGMSDVQRRRDVTQHAQNCGLADLLNDRDFSRLVEAGTVTAENVGRAVAPFVRRFGGAFRYEHLGELVPAALDIYYMRYHSILRLIEQGRGAELSRELLGESGRRLIEPMPGYDVFLPLIKGWLGAEVDGLYEPLRQKLLRHGPQDHPPTALDTARTRLVCVAQHFQSNPAKFALVTASISYEAHASMKEVIAVTAERVRDWPIAAEHRERIAAHLADYRAAFDGFVNATDACEHRLKPHRDLYSLALQQMSIPKSDYSCCVGLEDTEPGIIALRAAGIGCAVALPNRDTSGQDYSAATMIIKGGLPELILIHSLLLAQAQT